jgi:hypothetical protein
MKNKLTLVLAILIGLSLSSCHNTSKSVESTDIENKYGFADSILRDLTTQELFVISDSAKLYTWNDSTHRLHPLATLHLGDSISILHGPLFQLYSLYYSTQWNGKKVYVLGSDLGAVYESDFDGDGKTDKVYYGYTAYKYDTIEENGQRLYPYRLRFVSSAGAVTEIQDSGYSEMGLDEMIDSTAHFSKPTKVYMIHAGYPACGYEQFSSLLVFAGGKPEVIHRSHSATDSGFGDFYEIHVPDGSLHQKDTFVVYHRLSEQIGESESAKTSVIDTTLLYPANGQWQEKMYEYPKQK